MEDTLRESWKNPEIKKKILFTFLIVSILCLLTIIPIPGLSHAAATAKIDDWGSIGTVIDILSCGALTNGSIISLGIFPFLVASIVMQIVTLAVPKLRDLAQAGGEGTKLITKYTRIASLIASGVFAALYCLGMKDTVFPNFNFWVAIVLCGVSVAIGSAFCGWCVELLNTKGLGNGLTIIIIAGIIAFLLSRLIRTRVRVAITRTVDLNRMMNQALNMGAYGIVEFDVINVSKQNLSGARPPLNAPFSGRFSALGVSSGERPTFLR